MNITSKNIMIFKKEINGKVHYRAGLSNKKQDNTYDTTYIDVKLPKGIDLDNKTKIEITKGFLSFFKTKEGTTIFYIIVQEFSKENATQEKTSYTTEELDEDMVLPF